MENLTVPEILAWGVSLFGISTATAAWLVKKLIEGRLKKDIELYKSELNLENNTKLESLKAELQSKLKEAEVSVIWLHKKRALAIEKLYISIIELNEAARTVLDTISPRKPEDIRKYSEEAFKRVHSLYSEFTKTKIFLTHTTCEKIDDVLYPFQDAIITYHLFLGNYDDDELHTLIDVKQQSWKDINEKVKPAQINLENEFRKLLGVQVD